MTIAACYVSPEGVVLGADSTASFNFGAMHYYNHNQKVFELGVEGTLAVVTWGLGTLMTKSYRTLFALLADDLEKQPPKNVEEVAKRWAALFWGEYSTDPEFAPEIAKCQALHKKAAFDPSKPADPQARTPEEQLEYQRLVRSMMAGFCIGGYVERDRRPQAFEMLVWPYDMAATTPSEIVVKDWRFWGAPNFVSRLLIGCDDEFVQRLVASGKWKGTPQDLQAVIEPGRLYQPIMPIRDAIDFVHSCIYSTIKGIKFSASNQICGGPVELAVITTDRKFRWVRHKEWDAAIWENG